MHVHVDIRKSFDSAQSLGRFFTLLFNVAPALKSASRVNLETSMCDSLHDRYQKQANEFLQAIAGSSDCKRKHVMPLLKREFCEVDFYDKYVDINLNHSDFGKEGTIELRFFQSPRRPQDLHTIISFVDAIVAFAHEQTDNAISSKVEPDKYANVHQLVYLFCQDKPELRQKMIALLEAKKVKPVNYVAYAPDHWRTQIAEAVKMNDAELLCSLLKNHHSDTFDVEGVDPVIYAQEHELGDVQNLLRNYQKKPLDTDLNSINLYNLIKSARGAGLIDIQILRLFRQPEDVIKKVIDAKLAGIQNYRLNRLMKMTPQEHERYDDMLKESMSINKALQLVAREAATSS
jgi:hypothetical protein